MSLRIVMPRPMKMAKALLLGLFLSAPAAAQELAPDTVVDKLPVEASNALESGNHRMALEKLQ